MSILSDRDIIKKISQNEISVTPFNGERVQPCSYDVALGSRFITFHKTDDVYDPIAVDKFRASYWIKNDTDVEDGWAVLGPQEFMLAHTVEKFRFGSNIAGRLEGKSSLGRCGLCIHATAGFFDPGFEGTGTLELFNMAPYPIKLTPGMLIAQMSFVYTSSTVKHPYSTKGRYQDQEVPTASKGV